MERRSSPVRQTKVGTGIPATAAVSTGANTPLGRDVSGPRDGVRLAGSAAEQGDPSCEIDPISEKRVRRKLDRVVMPLLFLLYLVAFLDRSNIGNAHTAGMDHDLGLDDAEYQVRAGTANSQSFEAITDSVAVASYNLLYPLQYVSPIQYCQLLCLPQPSVLFEWCAIMWKLVPPRTQVLKPSR